MFNTYVYGTPLGFDFFEDVASLKDYFKGFYISTRKGSRLMVNRRDNGYTFYSYLRYGLMEKGGRPNSFFGMSVVIDNNEYAPNFKEVFDWFDYLFARLVERGRLFAVNPANIIQYRVSKFHEETDEVNWLKNNIPNLFTRSQNVQLLRYDSSFRNVSSGQILCFNIDAPSTRVLDALRRTRWIAVSPYFAPEEEPIELDFSEIESQLNTFTQELVPIAISPEPNHVTQLNHMVKYGHDTEELIEKFLKTERTSDERNVCAALISRIRGMISNISAIKERIHTEHHGGRNDGSGIIPNPNIKRCVSCGHQYPLNQFEPNDSNVCVSCRKRPPVITRQCQRCGAVKPVADFKGDSPVCSQCQASQGPLNVFDLGRFDLKLIGIIAVLAVVAIVSCVLIFGGKKSPTDPNKDDDNGTYTREEYALVVDRDHINQILEDCAEQGDFNEAYDYLESCSDGRDYMLKFKNLIELYLWQIIDTPGINAKNSIAEFFIKNRKVVDNLGISQNDWDTLLQSCERLNELIKKVSFSESQRAEAVGLVESLPDFCSESKLVYLQMINSIPDDPIKKVVIESNPAMTVILPDGTQKTITRTSGLEFDDGTIITVKSSAKLTVNGAQPGTLNPSDNGKTYKIEVKKDSQVIVSVGKIQLTLTGK